MRPLAQPYRFPPLEQIAARAALAPHDLQAALASGYQEGQQRGYHEGHASGLQRGRDEGLRSGHAEGLKSGTQQAMREVRERYETLAAPLDALLAALRQAQDEYQTALRKELVDLVARVSRQVIRCELVLQPVQLLALVDETLDAMPAPHKGVEVHLNGSDLARILEVDPLRASRWSLLADARLEPGECRVKTELREADAGCRQRLAACMAQVGAQLLEGEGTAPAPALQPAEPPAADVSSRVLAEAIAAAELASSASAVATSVTVGAAVLPATPLPAADPDGATPAVAETAAKPVRRGRTRSSPQPNRETA